MKMRTVFPIFLIGILYFFSGSSTDPNAKANELYVEASRLFESVKAERGSYSRALDFYKKAKENIERILSKYASSNVDVNLVSGQTKLSSLTLNEFRKPEISLGQLAEAEKKPLFCALLVAKQSRTNVMKLRHWPISRASMPRPGSLPKRSKQSKQSRVNLAKPPCCRYRGRVCQGRASTKQAILPSSGVLSRLQCR